MTAGRCLLLTGLALIAGVWGCGTHDIDERFRAERDLWRAQRAAKRLDVNPDLVSDQDILKVAARFERVGDRHMPAGVSALGEDREAARSLARLAAGAYLSSSQLYFRGGKIDKALAVAARVRDEMVWDPAMGIRAQQEVVRGFLAQEDRDAALGEMWRLAEQYPVATDNGRQLYNETFNAPMRIVRFVSEDRDSVEIRGTVDRCLRFYAGVRDEWGGRLPALLADIHTATLLEGLGKWREAGARLESVLSAYPDSVLRPDERSRVALSLGRLYGRPSRNPQKAKAYLQEARAAEPPTPASLDAGLALAAMTKAEGRPEEALAIYRDVARSARNDVDRAPEALFGAAMMLRELNRWDDALAELRSLRAGYPTSRQGLEVPFAIAAHYREIGEPELAASVLRRAEREFDEMIGSYAGTRDGANASRSLIRSRKELEDWHGVVEGLVAFSAEYGESPDAAALALLEAAAVCRDKLGDRERSDELLRVVEQNYPNTSYAEAATRMLAGGPGNES